MEVQLLDRRNARSDPAHRNEALGLARRLPSLVVAAKEIASSVMHGVHGRRRAGSGETFWQFRPFVTGESASRIDWRRSARDERLYVREREWEAAHTVWIWIDRSASMGFTSSLAMQPKSDRAVVLGLAAADLLVRGGERVGLLGLTRPLASRNIIDRLAEAMLADENRAAFVAAELPPALPLAQRSRVLMLGDLLSPPAAIEAAIQALAAHGARGHMVTIADPVEETFPFTGHTEFADVDSAATLRLGQAESMRDAYVDRLAAHRDAVMAAARASGWTVALHRTDRPASEALLALRVALEANDGQIGIS